MTNSTKDEAPEKDKIKVRALVHDTLNFMSEFARSYLGCGGPTSRLEESLAALGHKLGFRTEVYATPTGVFLSCIDQSGTSHTTLCRITESSMSLGKLIWLENIVNDVKNDKISPVHGYRIIQSKKFQAISYALWIKFAAAFLAGFALSYPAFGNLLAALASGFIAMSTWFVIGPGLKSKISSGIFRDFVGCTVTLVLSALCQAFFTKTFGRVSFEAYSIGGLVILVPGLSLTTAIAELADQNLVSGTAKLMQAMLTLLALAVAYTLFSDLSVSFGFTQYSAAVTKHLGKIISALGVTTSVACFGLMFTVPLKFLPWSTLTGLMGWVVLRQFDTTEHIVVASYLASASVGTLALTLGHWFKTPSQVFSVPGILAMLPGMLALTSFKTLATGQEDAGLEIGIRVGMVAGAIVFGLFSARIPFALLHSTPLWRAAQGFQKFQRKK